MKKIVRIFTLILVLLIGGVIHAQEATIVQLTQINGDFKEGGVLNLEAGKAYVFEVKNEGVGHEVGFVIAPKGKTEQEYHIKSAYVQEMIADGKTSKSNEVVLEKGEYEYFCPLNPTPHYKIIVE